MMGDQVEGFVEGLIEKQERENWIGNRFLLLKIEGIF